VANRRPRSVGFCPGSPSGPCSVFGLYSDASNGSHAMMLTGAGSTWSAAEVPLPSGIFSYWDSYINWVPQIACPSTTFCVVAPASTPYVLITGHGSDWGTVALPDESSIPVEADAAACASPSSCVVLVAAGGGGTYLEVGPGT
jgi:hypothetical protein